MPAGMRPSRTSLTTASISGIAVSNLPQSARQGNLSTYTSGMQNSIGANPARRPPSYPIASVDRALRLLLLVGRRSSVRLSEASQALGVAPSTAHRLLAMLAFHDFVRRDGDRRGYVAGPALAEIGRAR